MAFVTAGWGRPSTGSWSAQSCSALFGAPPRSCRVRPAAAAGRAKAPTTTPRMAMERTFLAVKPDGVNRGVVGEIISRFERKGFKLVALKLVRPSKELAETHYDALREKKFFPALVDFICSGAVVAMVWEGKDVVKTARRMIGATNPLESNPGTIRGDYAMDVGRNIIHGSDAVDTAEREISIWFDGDELVEWAPTAAQWVYE